MVERRRPDQDFSLTGRLLGPLWAAAGLSFLLASVGLTRTNPVLCAVVGVVAVLFGAGLIRVPWGSVPPILPRAIPYAACAVLGVVGTWCAGTGMVVVVGVSILAAWTGIALALTDLVIAVVLSAVVLVLTAHATQPWGTALWTAAAALPMLCLLGGVMNWLRRRLDGAVHDAAVAQEHAALSREAGLREREAQEQERALRAQAELEQRALLQRQVADQASALAGAASGVSGQTATIAAVVDEMSGALSDLSRTAQSSDGISTDVAAKALAAAAVMERLEATTAEITSASDVIQSIAEQTNLLALNATIESARAGEAGRGFAVVANEVKELARQSADNAEMISRTVAQVRAEVRNAVGRVAEISTSMEALRAENGALASAIEEQSASVREVAGSVGSTAADAERIADGVRALVEIAHA